MLSLSRSNVEDSVVRTDQSGMCIFKPMIQAGTVGANDDTTGLECQLHFGGPDGGLALT